MVLLVFDHRSADAAGRRLSTGRPCVLDPASYSYFLILSARDAGSRATPFPATVSPQNALIIAGRSCHGCEPAFLYLSRAPAGHGLDLTPIAVRRIGACFTWGIYRYRLFGLVPVARDMVVDSMDDGVIVLDAQRRLVDLNAAAERYTGCTNASLGRPIDEVVAWWNEAVAEDRPLGEGQPAVVKVEPGPRYFEVKVSAVRDSQRRFVGWLVVVHDISSRRRNEAERYAFDRRVQTSIRGKPVGAAGVRRLHNLLTAFSQPDSWLSCARIVSDAAAAMSRRPTPPIWSPERPTTVAAASRGARRSRGLSTRWSIAGASVGGTDAAHNPGRCAGRDRPTRLQVVMTYHQCAEAVGTGVISRTATRRSSQAR